MISVTGVTNRYSLQPALLEKHSKTLSWLSATMHWKSELAFFQKMLGDVKHSVNDKAVMEEIESLENEILHFTLEGIEELRRKLRNHESKLAKMLEGRTEWDTQYYIEHDALMKNASTLSDNISKLVETLRGLKVLKSQSHHTY
jgi:hypothetical protein